MADMNLDIIQNKLDALVEKVVQQEQSNDEFRVTYAQILERINTKIDVFSGTENLEKLAFISMEIRDAINKRQEVVDGKFSAIKSEFDRVNDILIDSFRSKDIVSAYERIEASLEQQYAENKEKFEEVSEFIEGFNALEKTNDNLKSNFAIIKEQNTIASENFAKQIEALKACNEFLESSNEKTLKNFETVLYTLQDFSDSLNSDFDGLKEFIGEKTDSVVEKIHETDSFIDLLNSNLSTLIQVTDNIFEDDVFQKVQSDVADILAKSSIISETLGSVAKNAEVVEVKNLLNDLNLCTVANYTETTNLINDVKSNIIEEVTDVISTEGLAISGQIDKISSSIENYSKTIEKLVEDVINNKLSEQSATVVNKLNELTDNASANRQAIVDELTDVVSAEGMAVSNQLEELGSDVKTLQQKLAESSASFSELINDVNAKVGELNTELTDVISTESVAVSEQIQSVANTVSEFKTALTEIREGINSELSEVVLSAHNEQINNALSELQSKFVTQLVQVADNISFEDELFEVTCAVQDCSDELKNQISNDIAGIKQEISLIRDVSGSSDESILNLLEKLEAAVKDGICNDVKALANGFKILTTGLKEEKDYVYTLPDIESDLSKIRLDLNKLQSSILQTDAETVEAGADIASKINSIKENLEKLQNDSKDADIAEIKALFTSLNEDVSSISKRTNKLILSSDEVNKSLNNNINGFTNLIRAFERQSHEFYNSALLKELCSKVNNIDKTGNSISQSNNILNEAFMYLAEWVDSASETFEEITNDVTLVKEKLTSYAVEEAGEKLSGNIKSLSIKVEEQDSKIEELENKLESIDEKLNKILSVQNDSKETKALLEYVASQVSVANEKIIENEKLALKMASMEKQLKKIEKNIAIITEYIDEDDDEFESED